MVYMPRHLSSLAHLCPAVFDYLASVYLDMSSPQTDTCTPTNPTPDIFASQLAAETVDPSLLNADPPATADEHALTTQHLPALNTPTIRRHPVSFYGHPLTLLAPMHNTSGVFLKDDIVYLADAVGNTMSISVPEIKHCLRFHTFIAKTKFHKDVQGVDGLVEPAAYRIVANYLNHDPLIYDKLVMINENGAIEYPAYKDNRFRPYSLIFDYPEPRIMHDAIDVFQRFDNSKEMADNTIRMAFLEATKRAARPKTPYLRGHQHKNQLRNKRRQDRDGDINMG